MTKTERQKFMLCSESVDMTLMLQIPQLYFPTFNFMLFLEPFPCLKKTFM